MHKVRSEKKKNPNACKKEKINKQVESTMMKLKNKIKKKKVEREGGELKVTVRRSFIVGERRER